jgi:hypothetical protein
MALRPEMPNTRPGPSAPPTEPAPDSGQGGTAPTAPGGFRSTGFGTTGFGSTVFDALPEVEARERAERSVFDVCHVGVVLRAICRFYRRTAAGPASTALQPEMPNTRPGPSAPPIEPAPDPGQGSSASTAPSGFRSTGFGPTGFGSTVFDALPEVQARERAERSVFDVCHVGVVLRALLFVHAALAVGTLFVAPNFSSWILLLALGSGTALPGVLLWLLATCGLKRALGELPSVAQASVAVLLGAACALVGAAPTL